jgi:hypothetical protein
MSYFMFSQPRVADLFMQEPSPWGSRGDSFLWRAMREWFSESPLPAHEEAFIVLIQDAFLQLTGSAITETKTIYISRFSHNAVLSGYISCEWWNEQGLPQLVDRYRKARRR